MKLVQTSDYIIYFDNVRVDPYILNWNTSLGLSAGEATGMITMFNSKSLMNWKSYLTQVRVFMKNIFTSKYVMVFEGEITDRSWDDSRGNSGKISYQFAGFFHWLNIPIPLTVNNTDAMDSLQNFMYEAQGINVNAVTSLFKNQQEISLQNKTIAEVVDYLFDKMNQGYYEAAQNDSSFAWAAVRDRFKVMVDIAASYRSSGFLDIFTLNSTTQIQTFYVYLNQVLSQLMFEFYQDRDGSFRIKNPSWSDDILKSHVLDECLIQNMTGTDQWSQEPTRVLAIGGTTDLYQAAQNSGSDPSVLKIDAIPVGLYIGDAQKGHPEEYYSGTLENLRQQFGITAADLASVGDGVSTDQWFDNISGKYAVKSPFTGDALRTDVPGNTLPHRGTDYGVPNETTLRNLGGPGTVVSAHNQVGLGGNILTIAETIGGVPYQFLYMHLTSFLVKVGDSVTPGQPIGISGGAQGAAGAGNSSGPHLHLGIQDMNRGVFIDPDAFLKKAKESIQRQQIQAASTAGTNTVSADSDQIMQDIAGFADVIGQVAVSQKVDPDLAKIVVAVKYHFDPSSVDTKGILYRQSSTISAAITSLSGLKISEWGKIRDVLYMEDAPKNKIVELLQRKFNDQQTQNATPAKGETSYNAFATADNVKTSFPFAKPIVNDFSTTLTPKFLDSLKTIPAPTSIVTSITPWASFEATAYIATCPGCTGFTKTGLDVRDTSKNYHVIAVDPNVIPLYSSVEIKGPKGVSGVYQALDIGGAIKGSHIDILMSTLSGALAFGREQIQVRILRRGPGDVSAPSPRAVTYAATNLIAYAVPPQGVDFQSYIQSNPGHVDPNMICAIIDVLSSWRTQFKVINPDNTVQRIGLMGIPGTVTQAIEAGGVTVDWLDGNRSIEFGSEFFANCLAALNNKPTLALAAYYLGDLAAVTLIATTVTKAYDYIQMRSEIAKVDPGATTFVEHVLDIYLATLHGDYIAGDPQKSFGHVSYPGINYDVAPSTNTDIGAEFTNKFAIKLSDEERRFKMNLSIFEQRLIRYDSTAVAGNSRALANTFIYQYAKYMMQLHRASSHGINVDMVVAMPFLRPGFNAWLEPSRKNLVAYVTGVMHQGTFSQGCFTSLRTEFVRTPTLYKDIDDHVFIGEHHVSAVDFGPVVKFTDMDDLKKTLIDLNDGNDEVVDDAFNVSILRDLYSAATPSENAAPYVTEWNAEYTKEEIESKISIKYQSAPEIIQKRIAELKKTISESEDFFINKLMATL